MPEHLGLNDRGATTIPHGRPPPTSPTHCPARNSTGAGASTKGLPPIARAPRISQATWLVTLLRLCSGSAPALLRLASYAALRAEVCEAPRLSDRPDAY